MNSKNILFGLLFISLIVLVSGIGSSATCNGTGNIINSTTISNGCTLNTAGTYWMSGETFYLNGSSSGAIRVFNGVILDANGSSIIGNGSSGSLYGIYLFSAHNVTIKNFRNITNYVSGIRLEAGNNNNITIQNISFGSNNLNSDLIIRIFAGSNFSNLFITDSYFSTPITPISFSFTDPANINNLTINRNHIFSNVTNINFNTNTINNIDISNNSFIGPNKIGTNLQFASAFNGTNILIRNNSFTLTQTGLFIGENSNSYNVERNYFYNLDQGISISGSKNKNITISRNIIYNTTLNYDDYDICFKIFNSTNLVINANNCSYFGSSGAILQGASYINFTNNIFEGIPFSQRSNYLANDRNDPYGVYKSAPLYKSWIGFGLEPSYNANVSILSNLNSNNLFLSNNSYTNVQLFMKCEGCINLSHDFSDFWYKKVSFPNYLVGEQEYFVQNDFNNLSRYSNGYQSDFQIGYASNSIRQSNITFIKGQYDFYKNINTSSNQVAQIFNLSNSLIYFSNSSVACSNINSCDGNINITLTPNNYSYVLDNFNVTEGVSRQFSPISLSGSSTSKTITSTLSQNINATVVVNVAQCTFGAKYKGTSINRDSCDNNVATFSLMEIPSGSSELTLSYVDINCSSNTSASVTIILLLSALAIVTVTIVLVVKGGSIDSKVLILTFISIIVGLILFTAIAQNLGGVCSG